MEGGEVIGAGGYGCVFRPSLKCKSNIKSKSETNNNYISKLLLNKHANEELQENNNIKPIILKIPNNSKYFLLSNITNCSPDTLSKNDQVNINKCSKFFEKNDVDINNLNNELDKFTIINIPYGGEDLEKYIYSNNFNSNNFNILNNILIDLLKNAIIPMNKLNLIHMDLKDQNILYSNKKIKIIDWGLAFIIKNNNFEYNNNNFNNNLYRRPLQFNLPYSILLLNDDFWKDLNNYLNYYLFIYKKTLNKETYNEIFRNIFYNFFENVKYGHNQDLTNSIFPLFYDNLKTEDDKFNKFIEIMVNIYTHIFIKYFDTTTNNFKINQYIKDIYLHNCDIFGLLTVYISIYESLKSKKCNVEPIKKFVIKYLFDEKYYGEPYNLTELYQDLNNLKILSNNNKTKKQKIKQERKNKTREKK